MGPCDDLPAKPELLHWGTMRRARRDLVTGLCCASVNSAIKEHGVMCRLTATAFDENDPSVRTLNLLQREILTTSVKVAAVPQKARLAFLWFHKSKSIVIVQIRFVLEY
ncbi:hypothetical protein AVEN_145359-1 [Araneus ventricosus]|uniref:Uncharacterized protein n=1 Tax=Araneus ventricosus TaxID=182803 RepID=A0A4Y2VTC1_ARAVE|nr:hypothetical protein AVEN_145359-1 [Araneus ventricosus]